MRKKLHMTESFWALSLGSCRFVDQGDRRVPWRCGLFWIIARWLTLDRLMHKTNVRYEVSTILYNICVCFHWIFGVCLVVFKSLQSNTPTGESR